MAKDRTNFKPADHFESRFKPEGQNLKLPRKCLGLECNVTFLAPTRTIRLCDTCRKKEH